MVLSPLDRRAITSLCCWCYMFNFFCSKKAFSLIWFYLYIHIQKKQRYIECSYYFICLHDWLTDCLPACLLACLSAFRLRSYNFYIIHNRVVVFSSPHFSLIVWCRFAHRLHVKLVCACKHVCVFVCVCLFRTGLLFWNGCSVDMIMYAISPENEIKNELINNKARKLASLQIISVNF